ncbi:MAG: helix-hairpin-helix domain-containing protein [Myxococcales bacterium FL481]|nr:MAG: helix-hairpin-helix domain-containing protein [Myxococcales bacterium FL481]
MLRRISALTLWLTTAATALTVREAAAEEIFIFEPASDESGSPSSPSSLSGRLNVNHATSEQWQLLPGIGPSTATKILAYRARYPFKTIEQVMRVKGIGRKTFNRIKAYLTVDGETTLTKTD